MTANHWILSIFLVLGSILIVLLAGNPQWKWSHVFQVKFMDNELFYPKDGYSGYWYCWNAAGQLESIQIYSPLNPYDKYDDNDEATWVYLELHDVDRRAEFGIEIE